MTVQSRVAAAMVEEALGRVFDPAVVSGLREDSPLAVLGMAPADAVCVADALNDVACERGLACDLGDAELSDARSVADLIRVVADACVVGGTP